MLGRLLCWFGAHDTQQSGWSIDEYGRVSSMWGFCVRTHKKHYCEFSWQLDN